eukprot:6479756-Amphidinium_carterae.1
MPALLGWHAVAHKGAPASNCGRSPSQCARVSSLMEPAVCKSSPAYLSNLAKHPPCHIVTTRSE